METEPAEEINNKHLYEQKAKECDDLKKQLTMERFCLHRYSNDNSEISFYTGFSSYLAFIAFFNCIKPTAQNMRSAYYISSDTVSLAGRKRVMLLIDELFMFMCRLRAGFPEQHLASLFNCSVATISRKIITWANFLYFVLGSLQLWLPKTEIQRLMPDEFKQQYPNTRVVISCTEIASQKPSSLVFDSQSSSHYKGTTTCKCLLGVAPHGTITFISKLYTGCMSDVEIVKSSGLLELLESGDDVMADKGFTIRKLLSEKGVTLNIPHFLSSKRQFSIKEVEDIENIAKLRIHIERMNRRIKENHLFDTPIPITLCGSINQLWVVACVLELFRGPLIEARG